MILCHQTGWQLVPERIFDIQANPIRKRIAIVNGSMRILRSEIVDMCEAIFDMGPLPVFGARVLGLYLCVRLTLILAEVQPAPGDTRRGLRRLPAHRLPRHHRLHTP